MTKRRRRTRDRVGRGPHCRMRKRSWVGVWPRITGVAQMTGAPADTGQPAREIRLRPQSHTGIE